MKTHWITMTIVSIVGAALCLAQAADEATTLQLDVPAALVRAPVTRTAAEIAAVAIDLPTTVAPDEQPGFDVFGYVEPAPANLLWESEWQMSADGRWIHSVELFSKDAHSLRVRFEVNRDAQWDLYVYDPVSQSAFGPYSPHHLMRSDGWSTIIFGDTIGLEFVAPPSKQPPTLPDIVAVAYGSEPPPDPGPLDGCVHRDVTCEPAWRGQANAVALLATLDGGGNLVTFCTGSLINRQPGDGSPLLMTANHCVGSQGEAGPTVFVWFFQTGSCNGTAPNPNTLPRSDGSLLLKRFVDTDTSLLGLFERPDSGFRLGWTTAFWDDGGSATGIHHPGGTFKRIAFGTKEDELNQTFCDQNGQNCFDADVWEIVHTMGFTQRGSSGSPIMSSPGALLRGTLSGGPRGDCTISQYGRFDRAYTHLRYYLGNNFIASPVYVNAAATGDPGNNGILERGTSSLPFNTVYEASFAVRAGDTVRIRPGNYNERMVIWRPMRLEPSASGTVRIGAP